MPIINQFMTPFFMTLYVVDYNLFNHLKSTRYGTHQPKSGNKFDYQWIKPREIYCRFTDVPSKCSWKLRFILYNPCRPLGRRYIIRTKG